MPGRSGPRPHCSRLAVVVLYVFVLAASAFFHHDFICHQNSRTHCIACSVSQYAQAAESAGPPLGALYRVAGRVEFGCPVAVATPVLIFVSDRAPPA